MRQRLAAPADAQYEPRNHDPQNEMRAPTGSGSDAQGGTNPSDEAELVELTPHQGVQVIRRAEGLQAARHFAGRRPASIVAA